MTTSFQSRNNDNDKDTPHIHIRTSPCTLWGSSSGHRAGSDLPESPELSEVIEEETVTRSVGSALGSPSAEVIDSLPVSRRRSKGPARQLGKLYIDQDRDRKQFGLDRLKVKVIPAASCSTEPRIEIDHPLILVSLENEHDNNLDASETTPTMSNHEQSKSGQAPGGSSSYQRGPVNLPPPSSRMRNPAPPSPLSRIQTTGGQGDHLARSLPTPSSSTVPISASGAHMVPPSPCFIHSHLDRTGTLQDWLQAGTSQQTPRLNGPPSRSNGLAQSHPASSSRRPHIPQHQARHNANSQSQNQPLPDISSAGSSRVTSPIKRTSSTSGYESDKSSIMGGSALLDGDIMDDEDDTGSLTRQLAETAQGVREMSKQLGRTRVRSKIQTVLIVTKARDNRLIKLTRELALYLMQKRPLRSPDGHANGSASTQSSFNSRPDDRGMIVYVDAQLRHSNRFDAAGIQRDHPDLFRPVHRRRSSSSASVNNLASWSSATSMSESRRSKDEGQLRYWTSEMCSSAPHLFDFVVTLGGDGTVLFTSWLFQKIVPPVLPFALGSLGFLTNFDFSQYKPTMDRVIDDGIRVNLRMRFTCTVYRAIAPEEAVLADKSGKKRKAIKRPGGEILMSTVDKKGWEALEGGASASTQTPMTPSHSKREKEKEIMCFTTRPVEQFEVLNDLVVDRGPSPFVSLLELFGDEHHLTTVQADGLTVSTPTGSTAYSLSAGGSLVHPQIPALLITPICPHTLSFRPMLLPDSMELRICVPYNSRSTAWASFDGRGRVELKQGDHIKVTASKYPFPTVCADKASTDWFNAISRTLRWNEREKQKSFVVVEEDNEEPVKKQSTRRRAEDNMKEQPSQSQSESAGQDATAFDEGEESDGSDSDEEEAFDIDDKSGGDNTPAPNTPDTEPGPPNYPTSGQARQRSVSSHNSGVDTPDRFMSPYDPPHAVSQRHLVDKLNIAEVELSKKDNEDGQRDHIRGDSASMRVVPGHHMIPSGRNLGESTSGGSAAAPVTSDQPESSTLPAEKDVGVDKPEKTPVAKSKTRNRSKTRRPADMERKESRPKAFAFFGQDDSASDQSEEENPQ